MEKSLELNDIEYPDDVSAVKLRTDVAGVDMRAALGPIFA